MKDEARQDPLLSSVHPSSFILHPSEAVDVAVQEYLLSYGVTGDFGRFRPLGPVTLGRGDRAVVRSHRGLELAEVLCPARPGHARFLPNTTVGSLLRPATPEDEAAALRMQDRGQRLFEEGRLLAGTLGLPLTILDAEVLLDGEHGIVHHLTWGAFDERDLVSVLSRKHDLHIVLHSLRTAGVEAAEEEEHGCGREGCGRSAGGCSTCGSGGCGTCGSQAPADLQAYFLELRRQMHERDALRTRLL
jgi:hypothetical protein